MIDLIQEIYGTIKRNKLRTFLTGFAVAWGIFMLIVLLGSGNGLIHAFTNAAADIASNSVEIYPGITTKAYKGYKEGRAIRLTVKDIQLTEDALIDRLEEIGAVISPGNQNLSYKGNFVSTNLNGTFPIYLKIQGYKIKEGRYINQIDIKEKRKVIVLNEKTIEQLFNKSEQNDAIGKYINSSGIAYKIIGIYKSQGNMMPGAYIPFSTAAIIYNKTNDISELNMLTKDINTKKGFEKFETDIRQNLGARHDFDSEDNSAIWIWGMFEQLEQQATATRLLRIAIWIIGIFTLLSGIVGVSNIMLITVKERTKEFGIRKALGAKPMSILRLIIIESITITTIFGYIGMITGIAATEYLNVISGNKVVDIGITQLTIFSDPTVDLSIAIEATLTLIIAGTLAGFFPARKAVMIKPIEALRAE
ncbi:ABC transporter permease [Phocaeicola oris]|uniref:ABC transporter permease n=1 Tax=Phocaeicola oris TaxID=2896850 RepID=UPI00234F41FB|nr:ABC transporter permease [Phocaeicola oris]MCE2616237.1 ABC transporter permease [Phocaeicola oris]